jgi:hypothetical protein
MPQGYPANGPIFAAHPAAFTVSASLISLILFMQFLSPEFKYYLFGNIIIVMPINQIDFSDRYFFFLSIIYQFH